jgi:hypothetical protein
MKKLFYSIFILILITVLFFYLMSLGTIPKKITYGVSFSKYHADELHLDWKQTYLALLNDLNIKHFRFSAHWPSTEPRDGQYDFSVLDYQMQKAQSKGADVIFAVGKKLPGWPECHIPDWASKLSSDEQNKKLLDYIQTVVNRYKNYSNIKYWQVENEPFLNFGPSQCGKLDENFVRQEIALVKKIDPAHPVLITDGGELGTWYQAYRNGDAFGSSLYLYVYTRFIGYWRYPINSAFFRIKENLMKLFYGSKPSLLIELEAEPWLPQPIADTPIDQQFQKMDISKLDDILRTASQSGFDTEYLWGGEWWYWLKLHNHPEFWNKIQELRF